MKKLLSIIILLSSFACFGQEKISYTVKGITVEFKISPDEYYMEYKEANKQKVIQRLSSAKHVELRKNAELVTLSGLSQRTFSARIEEVSDKFKGLLDRIEPVLIYENGAKQICTGELIVKMKTEQGVHSLFSEYSIKVAPDKFIKNQYIVKIDGIKTTELLALTERLQVNENVDFAEPNFTLLIKPLSNDPYYTSQWSIKNSSFIGADMHVEGAWSIATGQNIKVAIIDEGVDLSHPDLAANLLPGYDATGGGSSGGPNANDAHGTACAGIVAAVANNNIGIAGIAYDAKILPVRVAVRDLSTGLWITTHVTIADGITWAKLNGADIMSNSYGVGGYSISIDNAISDAVINGRGGKGCLMLFGSGNDNSTPVDYPSYYHNTISVGATSMCDERKSPTSCDGMTNWGSNYGTGLDLVAPGVGIYTTDISGTNGYDNGDYISWYWGTSAACPNAAGVMALILSANPNLTHQQARDILETTCDKVGGYTYSTTTGHYNGTWNNEMGYGRVNACAAVNKALASSLSISGPSYFCDSATYSIPNLPVGSTVVWRNGGGYILSTERQLTLHAGYSTVTLTATITTNCGSFEIQSGIISIGPPEVASIGIFCEESCGGPDYLLCTGSNSDEFANVLHYQLGSTPVHPVKLHYRIGFTTMPAIAHEDSVTVTSNSGYLYNLPKNLSPGTYYMTVWTSLGSCNISEPYDVGDFYVEDCGEAYSRAAIYPNPASSELKISYQPTNKLKEREPLTLNYFSVKLLSKSGKVLRESKLIQSDKEIVLQIADLPNDTYFLHIFQDKKVIKKQVVIQH